MLEKKCTHNQVSLVRSVFCCDKKQTHACKSGKGNKCIVSRGIVLATLTLCNKKRRPPLPPTEEYKRSNSSHYPPIYCLPLDQAARCQKAKKIFQGRKKSPHARKISKDDKVVKISLKVVMSPTCLQKEFISWNNIAYVT